MSPAAKTKKSRTAAAAKEPELPLEAMRRLAYPEGRSTGDLSNACNDFRAYLAANPGGVGVNSVFAAFAYPENVSLGAQGDARIQLQRMVAQHDKDWSPEDVRFTRLERLRAAGELP